MSSPNERIMRHAGSLPMIGYLARTTFRPRVIGLLFGATCLAAAHAAQAQQLCPGAAVPGVAGPITNGSDCSLMAMGSTINALYVGGSAGDEDSLSLPGSANGVIFDNRYTPVGTTKTLTGVTTGEVLDFTLTNVTAAVSFVAGVGYENTSPPYSPVYHFAYFDFDNNSAYDAIFGASGPLITGGELSYIRSHGGFSDWTFVSVEDLTSAGADDWNDLVYAFQDIRMSAVPEPDSLGALACGVAVLPWLRRRKRLA
jgi:hypothetical protein